MPGWHEGDESQDQDIDLIKQAQEGDEGAFGVLYERHAPAVFRFLYSHLDDRHDAEDLTEEVFLRVWQSLPKYRHQGTPFVAFVFRVARNRLIDYYRRSRYSKNTVSIEDTVIRDTQPDPSRIVSDGLEHEEIRLLLNELRDEYKTVLVLRFLGDLSPDETAEVMGKSSGAVRVLQHRALAALRKLMSK